MSENSSLMNLIALVQGFMAAKQEQLAKSWPRSMAFRRMRYLR